MRTAIGRIAGTASAFEFDFVVTNPKAVRRVKVWNDADDFSTFLRFLQLRTLKLRRS